MNENHTNTSKNLHKSEIEGLFKELYDFINSFDPKKINNPSYLKSKSKSLEKIVRELTKTAYKEIYINIPMPLKKYYQRPEKIKPPKVKIYGYETFLKEKTHYDYKKEEIHISNRMLELKGYNSEEKAILFFIVLFEETIHHIQQIISPRVFKILEKLKKEDEYLAKSLEYGIEKLSLILLFDILKREGMEEMFLRLERIEEKNNLMTPYTKYIYRKIKEIERKRINDLLRVFATIGKEYSEVHKFLFKLHELLS